MQKGKKRFGRAGPPRIGETLLRLAEEDCCASEIDFVTEKETLKISSGLTRTFIYGKKFRILVDPEINGKKYPYAFFNVGCTWRGPEKLVFKSDRLKRVYQEVNKKLTDYYARQVKIIKPGTYLFHNLTDGERHEQKAKVRVYTSVEGKLSEVFKGEIERHEGLITGGEKTKEPFILKIKTNGEIVSAPAFDIELLIFEAAPVFKQTAEGRMGSLSVELLRRGHICSPQPSGAYILDCCDIPRLLFIRLIGDKFTVPSELHPGKQHDLELKQLIEKYGQ